MDTVNVVVGGVTNMERPVNEMGAVGCYCIKDRSRGNQRPGTQHRRPPPAPPRLPMSNFSLSSPMRPPRMRRRRLRAAPDKATMRAVRDGHRRKRRARMARRRARRARRAMWKVGLKVGWSQSAGRRRKDPRVRTGRRHRSRACRHRSVRSLRRGNQQQRPPLPPLL